MSLKKINGVSACRANFTPVGTPLFSAPIIPQWASLYKAEEIPFSSNIFVPFAQIPVKAAARRIKAVRHIKRQLPGKEAAV
jgi:hypothetical protein